MKYNLSTLFVIFVLFESVTANGQVRQYLFQSSNDCQVNINGIQSFRLNADDVFMASLNVGTNVLVATLADNEEIKIKKIIQVSDGPQTLYSLNFKGVVMESEAIELRFTDGRDGRSYRAIEYPNGQVWMAENLKYNATGGRWCYEDVASNCERYGALYNWYTAKRACPVGWHLPTDAEWQKLIDDLGGEEDDDYAFEYLRENSVFSGLPGGFRSDDGSYNYLGNYGYWWSATESSALSAWYRLLGYAKTSVNRYGNIKAFGFSVRCVRDE